VVKPVINGLFGSSSGDQQQCSFRRSRMGNGASNFDVNAAGKITVIKGGLDYSLVVTVGGLIIIEPVSVKRHSLGNYSKSSVKWQRRFHELKSTQRK
jgi:hypothetical protein